MLLIILLFLFASQLFTPMEGFIINTRTTGFGSPARSYVDKRLDTNELLVEDPYSTFFFQWQGEEKHGLSRGDYLVVDRGITPDPNDLVITNGEENLSLDFYRNINPKDLWGTITWKLCKLKK